MAAAGARRLGRNARCFLATAWLALAGRRHRCARAPNAAVWKRPCGMRRSATGGAAGRSARARRCARATWHSRLARRQAALAERESAC
jgi:hypothetical protein